MVSIELNMTSDPPAASTYKTLVGAGINSLLLKINDKSFVAAHEN